MQVVTNPVNLPSFYCMYDLYFLQPFTILHFSHVRSNWPSPSFSNTTFQNFPGISGILSEGSKSHHRPRLCPKCSTLLVSSLNLSPEYGEEIILLVECCLCHGNPGFTFTFTSCIICYQATQIAEMLHILRVFLFYHNLYWGWLPWIYQIITLFDPLTPSGYFYVPPCLTFNNSLSSHTVRVLLLLLTHTISTDCLSDCTVLWVSGKVSETQRVVSPVHTVTSMWIHLLKENPETSDNETRWTIRGLILGTVKVTIFFKNALSHSGVCKPPTRWIPWVKPPGPETGLSPPSSVDGKKSGVIYLILLKVFMARAETKSRIRQVQNVLQYLTALTCGQHTHFCSAKQNMLWSQFSNEQHWELAASWPWHLSVTTPERRFGHICHVLCIFPIPDV
jgi:hypothetical protein